MNFMENKIKRIISLFLSVLYISIVSLSGFGHTHGHVPLHYNLQKSAFQNVKKSKLTQASENCLACVFSQTNISTTPEAFSYKIFQAESTFYKQNFFQNTYRYAFDEVSTSRGPPAFL